MKTIYTSIDIDAASSTVWELLTDLEAYSEWNPQTTSASGTVAMNEVVDLHVEPTGSRTADIRATVTRFEPESALEWVTKLPIPGLFTARHSFELDDLGNGRTHFINRERLSGLLVPVVVANDAVRDYEAMNRALKEHAERVAVSERNDAGTDSDEYD